MAVQRVLLKTAVLAGFFAMAAVSASARTRVLAPPVHKDSIVVDASWFPEPTSPDTLLIDGNVPFAATIVLRGIHRSPEAPLVLRSNGPRAAITGSDPVQQATRNTGDRLSFVRPRAGMVRLYGDPRLTPAREPDTGWLWIDRVLKPDRFRMSAPLPALRPDEQATLFLRLYDWRYFNLPVANIEGRQIKLAKPPRERYPLRDQRAFVLYGAPSFIDMPGEYALDPATGTIQLRLPEGLTTEDIRVASRSNGLTVERCDNVRIEGLSFLQVPGAAVRVLTSTAIVLRDLAVSQADTAIAIEASRDVIVASLEARDLLDIGVSALETNGLQVIDSQIQRCGLLPFPSRMPTAIWAEGDSLRLVANLIDSSAYNGIRWWGKNALIRDNTIRHTNLRLGDGGAIYCYQNPDSHSRIVNNRIEEAGDPTEGITQTLGGGGIYLDTGTSGVVVDSNVVRAYDFGVKLHNCHGDTVVDNTLVAFRRAAFKIREDLEELPSGQGIEMNIVRRNTCLAPASPDAVVYQLHFRHPKPQLNGLGPNRADGAVKTWATLKEAGSRAKNLTRSGLQRRYRTNDQTLSREETSTLLNRLHPAGNRRGNR